MEDARKVLHAAGWFTGRYGCDRTIGHHSVDLRPRRLRRSPVSPHGDAHRKSRASGPGRGAGGGGSLRMKLMAVLRLEFRATVVAFRARRSGVRRPALRGNRCGRAARPTADLLRVTSQRWMTGVAGPVWRSSRPPPAPAGPGTAPLAGARSPAAVTPGWAPGCVTALPAAGPRPGAGPGLDGCKTVAADRQLQPPGECQGALLRACGPGRTRLFCPSRPSAGAGPAGRIVELFIAYVTRPLAPDMNTSISMSARQGCDLEAAVRAAVRRDETPDAAPAREGPHPFARSWPPAAWAPCWSPPRSYWAEECWSARKPGRLPTFWRSPWAYRRVERLAPAPAGSWNTPGPMAVAEPVVRAPAAGPASTSGRSPAVAEGPGQTLDPVAAESAG